MVQAAIVSREDNNIQFDITVPVAEVDSAVNKIYQRLSSNQKIKGFRQGKAPREVLATMFGIEDIHGQALQDLLPDAYYEAVGQLDINPVGEPEFDPFPVIEEGKDLVIHVKAEVLPDIHLCDISSIRLEIEKEVELKPEDVDETILGMRKRMAVFTAIDRPCRENDRVQIDYSIKVVDIAGKEPDKDYDTREKLNLIIGDKEILPDIENNIIGLKAGEDKKFVVKYPENYQNKEIAGKSTSVEIKLHEVAERQLPEIDDEFLKKMGNFTTLEDLKKNLEARMKEFKRREHAEEIRRLAVEVVVSQTHTDIPEKLVDDEVTFRMEYMKYLLQQQGKTFEQALEEHSDTEEEYMARERESAKAEVKRRIVFNEIAKREKIAVLPEEISLGIMAYARENNLQKSETKKIARDRDRVADIRTQIRNMKIIDMIVTRAKFKGEPDTVVELAEAAVQTEAPEQAAPPENI